MSESSNDRAGSELLEELSARTRAGERLARRLGERRWGTVGGARREKLFDRLGLANPWDPDAPTEPPVAMGPVALKLTDRRQPAPHARPPNREPAKGGNMKPSDFRPKGIPQAAKKSAKAAQSAQPKPAKPAPVAAKAPTPTTPAEAPEPTAEEAVSRMPPLPDKAQGRSKTGRVRMARTRATAPIFKAREPEPSETDAGSSQSDQGSAAAPEPPVRREPPGGNMGLDDLFGFSAGPTRVRIARQKKKTLADELPPDPAPEPSLSGDEPPTQG